MSYTAPSKDVKEKAREVGYIAITINPLWAHKLDLRFVPFRASYRAVEGDSDPLDVAQFYLTVNKNRCVFEGVALSEKISKNNKMTQTLFLGLLVEAMTRWWRNFASETKNLVIESKNPDIAEILLENGFDISNSGNQLKGMKHVQASSEKEEKGNAGAWED